MYQSINKRNVGLVFMIREGKRASVTTVKTAKTIAPVKAETVGTVPAQTESAGEAVVLDVVCHMPQKQVPALLKVRELSVNQAVTFRTVPCHVESPSMQPASCVEGSAEWNLDTLFQRAGEIT